MHIRNARLVFKPAFANDVEPRILACHGAVPTRHSLHVGIRIGVHADAVDSGILNPPDGVLDKICHQVGVALIEVGHTRHKPSVDGVLEVVLAHIRIMHRVKPEVGEQQRVDGGVSLACQICLLHASDAVGCRLGI